MIRMTPITKSEVIISSEIISQRCPLIKEGKEGIATILGEGRGGGRRNNESIVSRLKALFKGEKEKNFDHGRKEKNCGKNYKAV